MHCSHTHTHTHTHSPSLLRLVSVVCFRRLRRSRAKIAKNSLEAEMVHVRGMVGANAGVDGGGGVRSGGVPRAGREDSWNMGLATLAGGVPGTLRFPSDGAEGAEGGVGADQGQPRLSAVNELHVGEAGVALDFRVDNPLARLRDADAGAAVAVAVAGRPQSAYFGAAPIAPCMPPNMPPVAHASNPAVIGNVAVASPAPMYVNADRQISLREDESTEEYECDGGEDDEEFEEKKGGEAGASNAPSEGKSAAPVPVVMPVMVLQAPVVVQADSMESIKYETLY